MNRTKRFAAATALAVVALVGMGVPAQAQGGTPIPAGPAGAAQQTSSLEKAEKLVEAWGTGDPDTALRAAHRYTAAGTTARAYAMYLAHDFRPFEEAGSPSEGAVRPIEGGWELCPAVDSKPADCAQFNGWEFQDGKISNFLLCERPIDDGRLLGSGKPIRSQDVVVQRMAAFASPFNPVYTVIRVQNGDDSAIEKPSATYEVDGETIEARVAGSDMIPAGETRTFEVRAVTPKGLGGTVRLSGDLSVPVFEQKTPGGSLLAGTGASGNAGAKEGCCGAQD